MQPADKKLMFTDGAREAMVLAQDEAERLGQKYIGSEHLLLGLVREGDGVAARTLDGLGVGLTRLRAQVEAMIRTGEPMVTDGPGLTPRVKRVIELAVETARGRGDDSIDTAHLLLGLLDEGGGIAASILESLGAGPDLVRARVLAAIDPDRPDPLPTPGIVNIGPGLSRGRRRPLPELRDLLGVVPIAQRQRRDGVEVLALALERYANGFIVTLQLQGIGGAPFERGFPTLPLEATDDRGGQYRGIDHGGSGGGGERWAWRTTRLFTPALDPTARELRLEAAALHFQGYSPGWRRLGPSGGSAVIVPGPWGVTVPLPPAGAGDVQPAAEEV